MSYNGFETAETPRLVDYLVTALNVDSVPQSGGRYGAKGPKGIYRMRGGVQNDGGAQAQGILSSDLKMEMAVARVYAEAARHSFGFMDDSDLRPRPAQANRAFKLAEKFDDVRGTIARIRGSKLGGIPVYRPKGIKGNVLPLFDVTDTKNLKGLAKRTGISLDAPEDPNRPLGSAQAEQVQKAISEDKSVEMQTDSNQTLGRIMGLFGRNVEKAAMAAATMPPGGSNTPPSGHVKLRLIANTPLVHVDYKWAWIEREMRFGKTDANNEAQRTIEEGVYRFATPDRNQPDGIEDEGLYDCFALNPTVHLRDF